MEIKALTSGLSVTEQIPAPGFAQRHARRCPDFQWHCRTGSNRCLRCVTPKNGCSPVCSKGMIQGREWMAKPTKTKVSAD